MAVIITKHCKVLQTEQQFQVALAAWVLFNSSFTVEEG